MAGLLLVLLCSAGDELAMPAPDTTGHVSLRSGSIFTAANFAVFGADAQIDSFYAFFSGAIGLPVVSGGATGATVVGAGFTHPITESDTSRWLIDVFGELTPSWNTDYSTGVRGRGLPYVGVGAGVGLRFLHRSGFTLGFKLPLIGFAFGPGSNGSRPISTAVGSFFFANLIALPIVSLGYRFEGE